MVEVFKTNVTAVADADMLIAELHKAFPFYKVNFDLDDCDHILRVKSMSAYINPFPIILLLKAFGFEATALPDDHHGDSGRLKRNLVAGEAGN
jgi:hypothetical protein